MVTVQLARFVDKPHFSFVIFNQHCKWLNQRRRKINGDFSSARKRSRCMLEYLKKICTFTDEQCSFWSAAHSGSLSPSVCSEDVCVLQLALFSGTEYRAPNPEKDTPGLDESMSRLTKRKSWRVTSLCLLAHFDVTSILIWSFELLYVLTRHWRWKENQVISGSFCCLECTQTADTGNVSIMKVRFMKTQWTWT